MPMRWGPGCHCCTPCNEFNLEFASTVDDAYQWDIIPDPTAAQITMLGSQELDSGITLASKKDLIAAVDSWVYKVRWDYRSDFTKPCKYRLLAQLSTNNVYDSIYGDYDWEKGDHVFGEFELLDTADDQDGTDYYVRLAIGQVVSGVETIYDSSFHQFQDPGSTKQYVFTFCRSKSYDSFDFAGEVNVSSVTTYTNLGTEFGFVENEAKVVTNGPATIVDGLSADARTVETGDVLHLSLLADRLKSTGWTIYRNTDASTNPSYVDVATGMRNDDLLVITAAGDVGIGAEATTVIVGEVLKLTDDTDLTKAASWSKLTQDPFSYLSKFSFTDNLASPTSMVILGSEVDNSPDGFKVGIECITKSAASGQPTLEESAVGDSSVTRSGDLDSPSCRLCGGSQQCVCDDEIEKVAWTQAVSGINFDTVETNNPFLPSTFPFLMLSITKVGSVGWTLENGPCGVKMARYTLYKGEEHDNAAAPAPDAHQWWTWKYFESVWFNVVNKDRDTVTLRWKAAAQVTGNFETNVWSAPTLVLEPITSFPDPDGFANTFFPERVGKTGLITTDVTRSAFDCANFSVNSTYTINGADSSGTPKSYYDGDTIQVKQA